MRPRSFQLEPPPRPQPLHRIVEIPISLARDRRDELLERCFSEAEARELRSRHPQSVAGSLAVKRALCQLVTELFAGHRLDERDITLGHDERGAPIVRAIRTSAPVLPNALAVSVTHTRRRALGLAALREPSRAG